MNVSEILLPHIKKSIELVFNTAVEKIEFQQTRKDFEGDITMVIFPLLKVIKGNKHAYARLLGRRTARRNSRTDQATRSGLGD